VRDHLGEQGLGVGAVIGARRLHERDRARECPPVTVEDLLRVGRHRDSLPDSTRVAASEHERPEARGAFPGIHRTLARWPI
jgi:hypothetical protein